MISRKITRIHEWYIFISKIITKFKHSSIIKIVYINVYIESKNYLLTHNNNTQLLINRKKKKNQFLSIYTYDPWPHLSPPFTESSFVRYMESNSNPVDPRRKLCNKRYNRDECIRVKGAAYDGGSIVKRDGSSSEK